MKYTATVSVTIAVSFEDNGELCLIDQAHDAASALLDDPIIWDMEVISLAPSVEVAA